MAKNKKQLEDGELNNIELEINHLTRSDSLGFQSADSKDRFIALE